MASLSAAVDFEHAKRSDLAAINPLADKTTTEYQNADPSDWWRRYKAWSEFIDPAAARLRYFGNYEIVRELARGGMGIVFLARQISLNRPVALKIILAGQLANETDVKRFYTEAEAAANPVHSLPPTALPRTSISM
jgi:serine/threonine protein kinase